MHGERKAGVRSRNFAVEDELWDAAKARAASEGRPLSEVIREFLREYVGQGLALKARAEDLTT
jgi:Ribbon-helix-helix protein, copG family